MFIFGGVSAVGNIAKNLFIKTLCFVKGTLVFTSNGLKPIEDIEVGDMVWSYNEIEKQNELKTVLSLSRNTTKQLLELSINNSKIICTPEHPFYIKGNWVHAKDLKEGDLVFNDKGHLIGIDDIKIIDKIENVYNLEIEGNHNYFVSENKILVHNNDCGFLATNNKYINKEISEVTAGRGVPRMDESTGLPTIYQNRNNSKMQRKWAGSVEYNVRDQPSGDKLRILEKTNSDGTKTYGYTTDHYKSIHEFKTSN